MDNSIYALYFLHLGVGTLVLAWMLYLQLSAYHENGNAFFKHLSIASAISIIDLVLAGIPYLIPSAGQHIKLFMTLGVLEILIVGAISIIASKRLFEEFSRLKIKAGERA